MKTSIKKQTVLFLVTLLFVTTSHAQWKKIKGNGNKTKITRTTSEYDGIKCAGSFDFILIYGEEGKISIEGEENLLEYIITEVKDNNLIIKTQKGIDLKTSFNKGIKITIPFKDISEMSLAGSGDLWNIDRINSENFEVSLSGSGDVILDINTNYLKASIAGSGDLTLKGNTTNLDAKVARSGDLHGFDLKSNNTDISLAGSGEAKVNSKDNLKARVAGSGDIVYRGNPKTDTKVAGSGSITNN